MLSVQKLNAVCRKQKMTADELAGHLARGGRKENQAAAAIRNWQKGLMTPQPKTEDVQHLASALGVEIQALSPESAEKLHMSYSLLAKNREDLKTMKKFLSHRLKA